MNALDHVPALKIGQILEDHRHNLLQYLARLLQQALFLQKVLIN